MSTTTATTDTRTVAAQDVKAGSVLVRADGTRATVTSTGRRYSHDGSLPIIRLHLDDAPLVEEDWDTPVTCLTILAAYRWFTQQLVDRQAARLAAAEAERRANEVPAVCGEHGEQWRDGGPTRGIRCAVVDGPFCETDWTELAEDGDGTVTADDAGWLHVTA